MRSFFCQYGTFCLLAWPLLVQAGAWGVTPIRIAFDGPKRTAALRVDSDDERALDFQVRLMRWSQDASGEDRYEPSSELLYFPQVLEVPPGEDRLIRVGTKAPLPPREQTFRLFIEELPPPVREEGASKIAVRLRFGVPIFFGPAKAEPAGEIRELSVAAGEVRFTLANLGNKHFRFEAVRAVAGETELGRTRGWYLLAGAEREYRIALDAEACAGADALTVSLTTDEGMTLSQSTDLDADRCRP